jgi:hypothetical protein
MLSREMSRTGESLKSLRRKIVLSLPKAAHFAEYRRRFNSCDCQRPIAVRSERTNVALLEDKERVCQLPGLEREMPRSAIQYVAVFDQQIQAALRCFADMRTNCRPFRLLISPRWNARDISVLPLIGRAYADAQRLMLRSGISFR